MLRSMGSKGFDRSDVTRMTLDRRAERRTCFWQPRVLMALLLGVAAVCLASHSVAQTRQITQLKDDVYRFQNNHHYSVFVVTQAGVLVTDPINASAAQWLKAEIAHMTDQPITHLVYSHSHADHASGGLAFGDGLTVVAQENAPATIDGVVANSASQGSPPI